MLDWIRQWPPTTPGDYFRWPAGATIIPLSDSDYTEVRNLLHETIFDSFYDDILLRNLIGFEYTIHDRSVHRREYYLSYAMGDTVYVISGWLGKFFSFYRATPGDFRYSVEDLQENVKILSSTYVKVPTAQFTKSGNGNNYFLEYIDEDHMTRVRNYLVKAEFLPDDSSKGNAEKYSIYNVSTLGDVESYNLIEITKFIDPEVIP
jgi:hypothetical protein